MYTKYDDDDKYDNFQYKKNMQKLISFIAIELIT